jgi:hypothetical protein
VNHLTHFMKPILALILSCLITAARAQTAAEVKNLSVNGGVEDGKVRLVIEGLLNASGGDRGKLIFATTLQHSIRTTPDKVFHRLAVTLDVLQGEPKELPLTLNGPGEIRQVTGEALQDWSIRQEANGTRTLVLRPRKGDKPLTQLAVVIAAESAFKNGDDPQPTLSIEPPQPALFNGFVKVESVPELEVQHAGATGLLPIAAKFLPEALRGEIEPEDAEPLAFQFHGTAYAVPLRISAADPESRHVVLRDFQLAGTLTAQDAAFILTATAHVKNPRGGSIDLLGGSVALTELPSQSDWRIAIEGGRYVLRFGQPGEYPLQFKFNAAVRETGGWSAVDFTVARSVLQPVVLHGLPADTQFRFAGAARPERKGGNFASFLPPDGTVKLAWKTAAATTEGKLFYSAEMLSQISVGPGLMRQVALLNGKVMQGELDRLSVQLRGAGEVTRVQGGQVLSWKVGPGQNAGESQLVVQFNQPQKGEFAIQVQTQTPIGAFPQTVDVLQLRPEAATRFAGHVRIVNDGAVRIEVLQARGLSQVSPEQFPESDATKAVFSNAGEQRFAYRFSGGDLALRIHADQILPELAVSQLLAYHLGEREIAIDAEIELDVREAPLRELLLRVPKGFAVARLDGAGLADHFLTSREEPGAAELRLVYGQPVSGRQVVQFRLELNQALGGAEWVLPQVAVAKAKTVRGHIAVAADAGFRLAAGRTQALTEIATAFFPRKVAGIQTAFRLSDPAWQATVTVERLPQSIQQRAELRRVGSSGHGAQSRVVRGVFQRRVRWEGSAQLAEDRRRLRRATALARRRGVHAARKLRAPVQGAGGDAYFHRRASIGCTVRAGAHAGD